MAEPSGTSARGANQSAVAAQALLRIAQLYEIESRGKMLTCDARKHLRTSEALAKLQDMHEWMLSTRQGVANGSSLAKAMDYSLKRWVALSRYARSGDLPIDKNAVENVIRPIAVGKKNWLFTGSERAGCRAAAIQSLLATAKLNGLAPHGCAIRWKSSRHGPTAGLMSCCRCDERLFARRLGWTLTIKELVERDLLLKMVGCWGREASRHAVRVESKLGIGSRKRAKDGDHDAEFANTVHTYS